MLVWVVSSGTTGYMRTSVAYAPGETYDDDAMKEHVREEATEYENGGYPVTYARNEEHGHGSHRIELEDTGKLYPLPWIIEAVLVDSEELGLSFGEHLQLLNGEWVV